jgi:hypothetical protein
VPFRPYVAVNTRFANKATTSRGGENMRTTSRFSSKQPLPLLAAFAIVALSGAGAAAEQTAQPAFEACQAARCLGVELSANVLAEMGAGNGIGIDALASGLRVRYEGDERLTVRVIAIRYQDGRLVRYRVSDRLEVSPGGDAAALEGAEEALHGAFWPLTEREMFVTTLIDRGVGFSRIAMERMVGNLPLTYLISEEESRGLLDAAATDENVAAAAFGGALGIVALLPEQAELRAPEEVRSHALLVKLNPVRR